MSLSLVTSYNHRARGYATRAPVSATEKITGADFRRQQSAYAEQQVYEGELLAETGQDAQTTSLQALQDLSLTAQKALRAYQSTASMHTPQQNRLGLLLNDLI